jgi:FkbM family methyltransferase
MGSVMDLTNAVKQAKKRLRRQVRYHWLTERAQYLVRRNPILKLTQIGLNLEIRPGEVIIDCGANVGNVTSLFARAGANVYSFEPNPLCFAILSKRFSAMPTVRCFNSGVMNRCCTLKLRIRNPHSRWDAIDLSLASSFVPGTLISDAYTLKKVEVECLDLSEFIRSLGSRVRLLKIDIEGSELAVLNHLIDTGTIELIDLALVETHEQQMPWLLEATNALRERIRNGSLETKIRLDWP